MQTRALFSDGESALATETTVSLVGSTISWEIADESRRSDLKEATLVAPVGRAPWRIELKSGESLQIPQGQFADAMARSVGQTNFAGKLEASWKLAVVALIATVLSVWLLLGWGVPFAALHIARTMPAEYEQIIANNGLGALDKVLFAPSDLSEEAKLNLKGHFEELQAIDPGFAAYRLEFRSSPKIGANAFAVPGGLVVMTDQMVDLAESDDELIAVLAHEVGHLAHRHSLRILLQDSATAVLFATLTGDLSSVTALSGAVPTVLMQSKYSRDFEREADDFAFEYLELKGIDTGVLSKLLLRLENGGSDIPGWLSTHPQSSERLKSDE